MIGSTMTETSALARRVGCRTLAIYLFLFCLPFPLDLAANVADLDIPPFSWLLDSHRRLGDWLTSWVGQHVFGLGAAEIVVRHPSASGDTMFHHVYSFALFAFAIVAAVVWSAWPRRDRCDRDARAFFLNYVRLALAATMLGYGMAKIVPTQFPPLGPDELLKTFADSSPMGLLWRFMSASRPYSVFAGSLEVGAAVLLLFRSTVVLGALWTSAVLLNVLALNLCYDVPVKLLSCHLLVMALLLAMPGAKRLIGVLLLSRPVAVHSSPEPAAAARWKRRTARAFELTVVLLLVLRCFKVVVHAWSPPGPAGDIGRLPHGLYRVERFEVAGVQVSLPNDASRWRHFGITRYGKGIVQAACGKPAYYQIADAQADSFRLYSGSALVGTLTFKLEGGGQLLQLEGTFKSDVMKVYLRRAEPSTELLGRGFHWIQEMPYNR